jgi:hypothetical protein
MPLQTSGPISLDDIQNEFGGSDPISISEYYGAASGIPASGAISIGDFYGASAVQDMTVTTYTRPGGQSVQSNYTRTSYDFVSADIVHYLRVRRADPYVYVELRSASTNGTHYRYDLNGTANAFTTTYVILGRFELSGIESVKIDWSLGSSTSGTASYSATGDNNSSGSGATYAAADNTWQSLSNGQSIGVRIATTTYASCYSQSTATTGFDFDVYARKTGYNDGRLTDPVSGATIYRIQHYASATAYSCF